MKKKIKNSNFNIFNPLTSKFEQIKQNYLKKIKTENAKILETELLRSDKRIEKELENYTLFLETAYKSGDFSMPPASDVLRHIYLKSAQGKDNYTRSYFSYLLANITIFGEKSLSQNSFLMLDVQNNFLALASTAAFSKDFNLRKKAIESMLRLLSESKNKLSLFEVFTLVLTRLSNQAIKSTKYEEREQAFNLLSQYGKPHYLMIVAMDSTDRLIIQKAINALYEKKQIDLLAFIAISSSNKQTSALAFSRLLDLFNTSSNKSIFFGFFASIGAFSKNTSLTKKAVDILFEHKAIDQLLYVHSFSSNKNLCSSIKKRLNELFLRS